MKKIILSLFLASLLMGDISTQGRSTWTDQQSQGDRQSQDNRFSDTKSKEKTSGTDYSTNKDLSKAIEKIRTEQKTITTSQHKSWQITFNPIPYILDSMRDLGWYKYAFHVNSRDLGIEWEEEAIGADDFGFDVMNTANENHYRSKAGSRAYLARNEEEKIKEVIGILLFSSDIISDVLDQMQQSRISITDIESQAKDMIARAYVKNKNKNYKIPGRCQFDGDLNNYVCDRYYALRLSSAQNDFPKLLVNAGMYYSNNTIKYKNYNVTINFAKNVDEALQKIESMRDSQQLTRQVREYASKLEREGKTKEASYLKSKYVEAVLQDQLTQDLVYNLQNSMQGNNPANLFKIF